MKNSIRLLVIICLFFISCKKEETSSPATNNAISVFSDSYSRPIDTTVVEMNKASATSSTTIAPSITTAATISAPLATAKGMNPVHGAPGHRCDIAVGAPLNSPVIKTATTPKPVQALAQPTTVANSPMGFNTDGKATISTSKASTPVVTALGMNPPHGQDSHLCSIAVGAPLPKT